MVAMLSQNILVEYLPSGITLQTQALFPSVIIRIITFICFGLVSVYISKRCTYRNLLTEEPPATAENAFMLLQANILILDTQGQILLANPAACTTLNQTEEKLLNLQFTNLYAIEQPSLAESHGTTAYLQRPEQQPLPISYKTSTLERSEIGLPTQSPETTESQLTLLIFTDISKIVQLEHQLKQVERITAATEIAGEMAHEIRTPLTSISASVQLLRHYEEKATASDWLPNSPRRKDRAELFEHIMQASDQMDSVIKNFVDFAEFSPADLLSIIKLDYNDENKGYIGQFNSIGRGSENGQDSDSGRRSDDIKFIK
jgi:nitrogen fixation/metabolism regulation signal transduction histidine kinase